MKALIFSTCRCVLAACVQTVVLTINTGGHGPSGASNLTREAGTFDSLRSLLNLVLVAAAVGSNHLARPCLHVHCEREKGTQLNTKKHTDKIVV